MPSLNLNEAQMLTDGKADSILSHSAQASDLQQEQSI